MKPLETGAPANAKLLESHAADAEREVVRIKGEIAKLSERIPQLDGSDEAQRKANNELMIARESLNEAYDLWFKLSKQVREYDKAVSETRRDGEKIAKSEVERMLIQVWRFQRYGREAFIISISQDAVRCKDEQDFYAKYAEAIRDCETNALRTGIDNEKFQEWVMTCYENSL